jgi:ABC-type proline/glycine betaine transport system permease subunit
MIHLLLPLGLFDAFSGAIDFIFHQREAVTKGGVMVGGPAFVGHLLWTQVWVSLAALGGAIAVALPVGLVFGHRGQGEFLAVGIGNAGRAVPELAAIFLLAAIVGIGARNLIPVLVVLGVPPILTNTFVGIRQVDRTAVEAARGMGMKPVGVVLRVELPLAMPTIMTGVRISSINIIATATIASFVGISDLGDLLLGRNVFGDDGVLAGGMLVAAVALTFELVLAGIQRLLTPKGLRLQRAASRA